MVTSGFTVTGECTASRRGTRRARCSYIVSVGAELPEGLDEEPGALVPRPVQSDPHGVLLQQSGQTFVHREVFVALHVEQLRTEHVRDEPQVLLGTSSFREGTEERRALLSENRGVLNRKRLRGDLKGSLLVSEPMS